MREEIIVYDKPWLLTAQEQRFLLTTCYPLVCQGFGREAVDPIPESTRKHILNCQHLCLFVVDGQIIAFTSWEKLMVSEGRVLYLFGVIVLPNFQGSGCGSKLLKHGWELYGGEYLAARTQNPVLYSTIQKSGFKIYPDKELESPIAVRKVAMELALVFWWDIDPTNYHVLPNAYGRSIYKTRPQNKNQEIEGLFTRLLNFKRGDALLLIAQSN